MTIGVKICGIMSPVDLEAAISAGASHFGMVFFPPSPRSLSLADAAALARQGRIARGSSRSPSMPTTRSEAIVAEAAPDMIQLHGKESPERTARIRELTGRAVIKAISVAEASDIGRAAAYRGAADLILFDAKPPRSATRPGGNGLAFDWRLLAGVAGGCASCCRAG